MAAMPATKTTVVAAVVVTKATAAKAATVEDTATIETASVEASAAIAYGIASVHNDHRGRSVLGAVVAASASAMASRTCFGTGPDGHKSERSNECEGQ